MCSDEEVSIVVGEPGRSQAQLYRSPREEGSRTRCVLPVIEATGGPGHSLPISAATYSFSFPSIARHPWVGGCHHLLQILRPTPAAPVLAPHLQGPVGGAGRGGQDPSSQALVEERASGGRRQVPTGNPPWPSLPVLVLVLVLVPILLLGGSAGRGE